MTACHELECLLDYKRACASGRPCHVPFSELEDAIALGERPCRELLRRLTNEGSVPPGELEEIAALQVKRFARAMRERNLSIRAITPHVDVSRGTLNRLFRTCSANIKSRCYASVAAFLNVPLFSVKQSPTTRPRVEHDIREHLPRRQPDPSSTRSERRPPPHNASNTKESPGTRHEYDHENSYRSRSEPSTHWEHQSHESRRHHPAPETEATWVEHEIIENPDTHEVEGTFRPRTDESGQHYQSDQSSYFRMSSENRTLKRKLSQSQREAGALREEVKKVHEGATREKVYVAGGAIAGGVITSAILSRFGDSRDGAIVTGAAAFSCLLASRTFARHNRSASSTLQATGASLLLTYAGMWAISKFKRMRQDEQETTEPTTTDENSAELGSASEKVVDTTEIEISVPVALEETRSETSQEVEKWPGELHPGIDHSLLMIPPYMPAYSYCETNSLERLLGCRWPSVEFVLWLAGFGGAPDFSAECNEPAGFGGSTVYRREK